MAFCVTGWRFLHRILVLDPVSCVRLCRLRHGSLLCRTLPLASGPAFCVRLWLLAQALSLGEFGVEEDEAGVAALLDLADDGVN